MLGVPLNTVLSLLCCGYFCFVAWNLYGVFYPRDCTKLSGCIKPSWKPEDKLKPARSLNFTPPKEVYRNGSANAHVELFDRSGASIWKKEVKMTMYKLPIQTSFNLLQGRNSSDGTEKSRKEILPVTYWLSTVRVFILSSPVSFDRKDIPFEIYHLLQTRPGNQHSEYLPVVYLNPSIQPTTDWIEVPDVSNLDPNNIPQLASHLIIEPISIGRLRMRGTLELLTDRLQSYGLKPKDVEEVRSLMLDTNFYLLLTTIFVSVFHILFDFLAFKNDISFWRNTKNTAGLSMRTVIWRFMSSLIIFLHLWEEKSSLLITVPMAISTCIELWKLARITKMSFSFSRGISWGQKSKAELEADQMDAQFMRWLVCLMIPPCLAGSIYSLMYLPNRSWYSWCLQTLVNGVYAFGFLLMTPQLFLNYRLKSVAHLPWKALTYKAFNTFIDDFFAFIISMPTSHRIACLRDDVIFLIYLYQKWLYPVDKSRVNEYGQSWSSDENVKNQPEKSTEVPKSDSKHKQQ